jgi:hypothetical protein
MIEDNIRESHPGSNLLDNLHLPLEQVEADGYRGHEWVFEDPGVQRFSGLTVGSFHSRMFFGSASTSLSSHILAAPVILSVVGSPDVRAK